uniref:ATP synthase F0 subunit 8 n=1 Tax=Bivetiella cancellata TaxID=543397 RepID=C8XQN6_BIVCA|nr:ATP synthase F0 subunit 8 [Bivetiella cancellata]ACF04817.1 ATP synthase F0 subunit 8 [Bivetiella cancellata]
MPQLSPLNWVFLYMLFWVALLSISVSVWWFKKNSFQSYKSNASHLDSIKVWSW